jgi:hypothetical protein
LNMKTDLNFDEVKGEKVRFLVLNEYLDLHNKRAYIMIQWGKSSALGGATTDA